MKVDAPHVVGKAFPQKQEAVALIFGEPGEEVRGPRVLGTGWSRTRWGGGKSGACVEGGGEVWG